MPRPTREQVDKAWKEQLVIPVFSHEDPAVVDKVATSLFHGGMNVFEFANRAFQSVFVFAHLAGKFHKDPIGRANHILGAGDVNNPYDAAMFIQAGADFIVGPNYDPRIAELCSEKGIMYVPGTMARCVDPDKPDNEPHSMFDVFRAGVAAISMDANLLFSNLLFRNVRIEDVRPGDLRERAKEVLAKARAAKEAATKPK